MKYGGLKRGPALALALTLSLASAAGRQAPGPGVPQAEEAEARAAAAAFAERLQATRDFAAVARELYADDFMSRQLRGLSGRSERARSNVFMLRGVSSLTFERTLAAGAGVEDWKRVRFAADNLYHFIFLSLLANSSFEQLADPRKSDKSAVLAVFPPEAVNVLDANPASSNFLSKKGGVTVVKTPEELRALAATLEGAVRLTRPRLAEWLAKGKHLDENLRLFREGLARDEVKSAGVEAEPAGYPEGTRLYRLLAPNGYSLLLVRQGGAMKIVWAGLPSE